MSTTLRRPQEQPQEQPQRFLRGSSDIGVSDLLSDPYVTDTLAALLSAGGQDIRVLPSGPETPWSRGGQVSPDDPMTILLNLANVARRQEAADFLGSTPAHWNPTNVLTHETGHALDFSGGIPAPIQQKMYEEIYGSMGLAPETVESMGALADVRHGRTPEEGFAEALAEAMLFTRDQGPYADPANQNLIALRENAPGSVTALSFIADRLKALTEGKKNDK